MDPVTFSVEEHFGTGILVPLSSMVLFLREIYAKNRVGQRLILFSSIPKQSEPKPKVQRETTIVSGLDLGGLEAVLPEDNVLYHRKSVYIKTYLLVGGSARQFRKLVLETTRPKAPPQDRKSKGYILLDLRV